MDSIIDEPIRRVHPREISLTPTMFSKGDRLETETEMSVANSRFQPRLDRSLRLPYPASVLCAACLLSCVATTGFADAWKTRTTSKRSLVSQTTPGDVLLLKRVIQALAQSRLAVNSNSNSDRVMATQLSKFGDLLKAPRMSGGAQVHDGSSNYSTDILIKTLYQKMMELNKIKSVGRDSTTVSSKIDLDIPDSIVQYTNNGCPVNDVSVNENDECNAWKAFVFEYLFPGVLLLAILGNALTLAVYRSRYLKSAATVLLLAVKAQANLAFVCCLTMEMIHYFVADDSPFQEIYWRSRPYTLFLANYFDSLAVWCTLAITLETYHCVSFPMSFRRWSKRRTVYVVIVCLMIASGLLHVAYPITRDVERFPSCAPSYRYRMVIRDGAFYYDYERIYFFLHALAVISLPVLLMAIFSVLIGYHFNKKTIGQRFSERRRCVLRITFATTVCTLVLQTPGLVTFAAAAIRGSALEKNVSFCTVNVVTTFLTIVNAAAPFLVYLSLNDTFRRLLFAQLGSRFSRCPSSKLCWRGSEFGNRLRTRANVADVTEVDQSHCGLSPMSRTGMKISRRSTNRDLSKDPPHSETEPTDNQRLLDTKRNKAHLAVTAVEDKYLPTTAVTIIRDGDSAKTPEAVRIIVEEAL